MHLIGLRLQPAEVTLHPIPELRPLVILVLAVVGIAVDHPALGRLGQFAKRHVHRHAALLAKLRQILLRLRAGARTPRLHRTPVQRQQAVGNGEVVINLDDPAEALAGRTRTERVIEAEQRRAGFAILEIARRAVEVLRETLRAFHCDTFVSQFILPVKLEMSFAEMIRLFARLDEARAIGGRELHPVLNHSQRFGRSSLEELESVLQAKNCATRCPLPGACCQQLAGTAGVRMVGSGRATSCELAVARGAIFVNGGLAETKRVVSRIAGGTRNAPRSGGDRL